jgi:hypothetical protein
MRLEKVTRIAQLLKNVSRVVSRKNVSRHKLGKMTHCESAEKSVVFCMLSNNRHYRLYFPLNFVLLHNSRMELFWNRMNLDGIRLYDSQSLVSKPVILKVYYRGSIFLRKKDKKFQNFFFKMSQKIIPKY